MMSSFLSASASMRAATTGQSGEVRNPGKTIWQHRSSSPIHSCGCQSPCSAKSQRAVWRVGCTTSAGAAGASAGSAPAPVADGGLYPAHGVWRWHCHRGRSTAGRRWTRGSTSGGSGIQGGGSGSLLLLWVKRNSGGGPAWGSWWRLRSWAQCCSSGGGRLAAACWWRLHGRRKQFVEERGRRRLYRKLLRSRQ